MREERKWGWRSEKDEEGVGIKRHPSNFSVNLITYSCDGVVIIYFVHACAHVESSQSSYISPSY